MELHAAFSDQGTLHDAHASRAVAHWAYGTADRLGSLVWLDRTSLDKLSPHWQQLFAAS